MFKSLVPRPRGPHIFRTSRMKQILSYICASVLLVSCGGGGGSGGGAQIAIPDLTGIWAGSWQGTDPVLGTVTGTWEAELTQTQSDVVGTATLGGDVDCMDGDVQGGADANSVSGTVNRAPCNLNDWTLTAVDPLSATASGTWTQIGSNAQGNFSGSRIARAGGPRILTINPRGGRQDTIITLVGRNFGATPLENTLKLENGGLATILSASTTRLIARIPAGAASGPLSLTTAAGQASSATHFNVEVSSPNLLEFIHFVVGDIPQAVAYSMDGRKVFVANRGGNSIVMLNTADNRILTTTNLAAGIVPQALVASPDGKRVYVAGGAGGVIVLDAATIAVLDTIPAAAGGGAQENPNGIAISPDGGTLYVSDNKAGGDLSVIDIRGQQVTHRITMAANAMPLGIALHPDGQTLYLAVADTTGSGQDVVKIFDTTTWAETSFPVGGRPTGIAVRPDGGMVFVANQTGNLVNYYNTSSGQVTGVAGMASPTGIAVSPDGGRVYVSNRSSDSVVVLDAGSNAIIGSIQVGSAPVGIALSPDGRLGYTANSTHRTVSNIGGSYTLTVALTGSGYGTVTSSPAGIDCGVACQVKFAPNTAVQLIANPGNQSIFSGWQGDADCLDGNITLSGNRTCLATFSSTANMPSSGPGGGCFIATAAYGSPMLEEVVVLRQFRDRHLRATAAGRAFIGFYYRWSPPIAAFISEHEWARRMARVGLWPVVYGVKYPLAGPLGILLVALGIMLRDWKTRVAIKDDVHHGGK